MMRWREKTLSARGILLRLLLAVAFVTSVSIAMPEASSPKEKVPERHRSPYADSDILIEIIPSVNRTFGYDIRAGGKRLVHQPSIPGLPGNEGFATREEARAVAEFVAGKIRRNEMPPTVTGEDLKSMGVVK